MKNTLSLVGLLALPLVASPAHALPEFQFSAFGTLGAVHSSEDQADYTSNMYVQPDGAGHSNEWDFDVDSRIGAQLTAELTNELSAVVQVISEQRYDDTYSPEVEWANLKYDVTPDFSVRAGRSVLPTFMVSDTRKIGFANHWVRPPAAVYGLVPVTNNDGIDISYRYHSGALTNTLQAYYGRSDSRTHAAGLFEARDSLGIVSATEFGNILLRASFAHSHLSSDRVNAYFDGFRAFGPAGEAIADEYDIDGAQTELVTFGARYDPGDWFVQGEWARAWNESFLGTSTGWYASGGYRFGQITPYAGYAQRRRSTGSDAGLDPDSFPPDTEEEKYAARLNAALHEILRPNEYDTVTLGMRWDFAANLSLKLQLDHIDLADDSQGELINVQPGFQRGGSLNVFRVAIDFVYW